VKLYESGTGKRALQEEDLLRAVARHHAIFFQRGWAKYEEAVPGTLRLVPPEEKRKELERDYGVMRDEMIFGQAPTFDHILAVLAEIERAANGST
jgi:hypothetical protein